MTPKEKKAVSDVVTALGEGRYTVVSTSAGSAYVWDTRVKTAMRDDRGVRIDFFRVDAEKIARLYNLDALDADA